MLEKSKKDLTEGIFLGVMLIICLIAAVNMFLGNLEARNTQMLLSLGNSLESKVEGVFIDFTDGDIQGTEYVNTGDRQAVVIEVSKGWRKSYDILTTVDVGEGYIPNTSATAVYCIPVNVFMVNFMEILPDSTRKDFWPLFLAL